MRALPLAAGLALSAGAVAAGWGLLTLREQRRQTEVRLQETRAALDEKNKALTLVEEERQQLSGDYEALKTRGAQTDEELKQLRAASTQTQTELAHLSTERSDLQRRLDETERQHAALQTQLAQLRRQMEEEARRRADAEAQLNAAIAEGLTKGEVEQLAQAVGKERREAGELDERLEALSHAFEQLAWRHIELQEAAGGPALTAQPPDRAVPVNRRQEQQRRREAEQLAARYRHLGEWCMAAYQYPRAAQAFERSLTYQDNREIHATLAFLYSRLLPDDEKAAYHAALAPQGVSAKAAMDPTTQTHGLPRKSRSLVWRWLTQ